MKKLLLGSLILLGIFVAPSIVGAIVTGPDYTIEELQRMIAQLQAQILQLQAQNQPGAWCYAFNKNMGVGIVGNDVAALHTALMKEGIVPPPLPVMMPGMIDASANIKYNEIMATYVSTFQLKYRNEILTPNGLSAPTGYVGAATRAKLNALYTCKVPAGNQPPVISGVSGPTTLKVGETGTWTVRASDPENGTLNYFVAWGDEVVNAGVPTIMATNLNLQTTTFSHSYSRSGTFYPTFRVTDNSGQSSQTRISVVIGGGADISSINLLSPGKGGVWPIGSQQLIRWSTTNIPIDTVGYILLKNNIEGGDLYVISGSVALNGGQLSNYGGSIPWVIPNSLLVPSGSKYTIRIGVGNYDTDYYHGGKYFDSEMFSIVNQNPSITVLTPNGGEQWKAYTSGMIAWDYKNLSSSSKVDLYLQPVMPPCPAGMACIQVMPERIVLDKNIAINGSYNWIVATDIVNNPIPAGDYYMEICQAGTDTCDLSGQPFTITAATEQPQIKITSPNGGQTWELGDDVKIKYSLTQPVPAGYSKVVYLMGGSIYGHIYATDNNNFPSGELKIADLERIFISDSGMGIPPGQYRVKVVVYNGTPCLGYCEAIDTGIRVISEDTSDGYITIEK